MACDLCGSTNCELLFRQRDKRFPVGGEFSVVSCRDCGLVFVNPQPEMEELQIHYPGADYCAFKKVRQAEVVDGEAVFDYPKRKKGIYKYVRTGRILDVGCADGFFLNSMRKDGWSVCGVETAEYAADFARNRLGIDVVASWEEAAIGGLFDVITFYHSLEHLFSPRNALTKAYSHLKPGGLLVVEVPSLDNIFFLTYGLLGLRRQLYNRLSSDPKGDEYPNYLIDVPRHLYHFTPHTLRHLLDHVGFHAVDCHHMYFDADPILNTALSLGRDLLGRGRNRTSRLERQEGGNLQSSGKGRNVAALRILKDLVMLGAKGATQLLKPLPKGDMVVVYARRP